MTHNRYDQFVDTDVIIVDADIEQTVPTTTKRTLDASMPENSTLLDRIDSLQVTLESIDEVPTSPLTGNSTASTTLLEVVPEGHIVTSDLFGDEYKTIDSIDDLKKILSAVLIRFDTFPRNYLKDDYFALLAILKGALLYLYNLVEDRATQTWVEEKIAEVVAQIEAELATKLDTISDLDTIRSGAALGATALLEETDPIFMEKGASVDAVEKEDILDIEVVIVGRDTLSDGQLAQVETIIQNRFWFGTLAEYDAITEKDPDTIYFIEKS